MVASVTCLVWFLTAAFAARADGGAVTYVSAFRSFTAWVGFGPVTFETKTSAFNPFVGWTRLDLPNGPDEADSTGYASQSSWLNSDSIIMTGEVWGLDGSYTPFGTGGGTSVLNVVFSVPEASRYSLSADLHSSLESTAADWSVSLTNDDIGLVFWHARVDGEEFYQSKGTLPPGVYRLAVHVTDGWIGNGAGAGSCAYDIRMNFSPFEIPTPVSIRRIEHAEPLGMTTRVLASLPVRRRWSARPDGSGLVERLDSGGVYWG